MNANFEATENPELHAVRTALNGTPREKVQVATRAMRALHQDPNDTEQVFLLGIILNAPHLKRFLARMAGDAEGSKLLVDRPAIDSKHIDFDALRALPASTLGGAYVRYLDAENLDPDLFQAPPGLPEVPAYLAQRVRQTHDIWHVLTGYKTDVAGEVALQAFSYAQMRMPSSALLTLIGTVRLAPHARKVVAAAWEGFQRGAEAAFLPVVRFEDMWEDDLDDVRRRLQIRPANVAIPEIRV